MQILKIDVLFEYVLQHQNYFKLCLRRSKFSRLKRASAYLSANSQLPHLE